MVGEERSALAQEQNALHLVTSLTEGRLDLRAVLFYTKLGRLPSAAVAFVKQSAQDGSARSCLQPSLTLGTLSRAGDHLAVKMVYKRSCRCHLPQKCSLLGESAQTCAKAAISSGRAGSVWCWVSTFRSMLRPSQVRGRPLRQPKATIFIAVSRGAFISSSESHLSQVPLLNR